MLTLLVIFASITATLSSFPPVYNCSEGQSCNVECASTQFTTHCNNLTIIATKANNISISCEDNTYCDNMKIYCPKWNSSFSRSIQCDIRCIGSNNVCNQLKVYSLPSITQLRCGGYISCTAATIYASNNAVNEGGKMYFHCDPNTTCDSISIQYDGDNQEGMLNLWIVLYNQGIINNLTIDAANSSQLNFAENDAVRIPGLYNNSVIDCSHCIICSGFWSTPFTKILNTKFILTHTQWIDIEFGTYAYTQVFSFNEIYANYSESIDIRVDNEAVMTENKFYMQHASYVMLRVDGIFSNNTIFAENANNLQMMVYGKYYNNYLYGDEIAWFMFDCEIPGGYPSCDARSNSFLLSNAEFVNLHTHDYSEKKLNVSAIGGLYNSIITAENAGSFYVNCQKCNMLTLVTSPNKTTVICDGFGCLNLTLYTKYTVDDVNVSITNCNCTYNVKSACIDQWNIYCESNNYSEPSVVSSATICHGECCGDILNMLHNDSCPWSPSKSKFKINKYYFVIGGLAFVILVQQILLIICCRKICAKQQSSNNFTR
eukprot:454867_1